jgi:hypothetical protein
MTGRTFINGESNLSIRNKLNATANDSPYHLPNTTARWQTAKARGAANPARHLMFGDSNLVGEGAGSGTFGLDGAALLGMVNTFATAAGHTALGNFGDQNVYTGTGSVELLGSYDTRFTLGTNWASDSAPATLGGAFVIGAPAAAGSLSFSPGAAFDTFELWYPTVSTGSTAATVSVDGTVVDTLNITGANGYVKKSYTVSLGTHTLSFGNGATGSFRIAGVVPYAKNGTPITMKGGWCGAKAADLMTVTNPWSPLNAAIAVAPDFVTLYCTINDIVGATALATYITNIDNIVAALSAVADGCIVIGFPTSSAGETNGLMDQYKTQLMLVARDYGWSVFDSRVVFGRSNARAQTLGYRYDANHPNLAGHGAFGPTYYSFLAGLGF